MFKQKPLWLVKFLHYEYWGIWSFYLPLLPYLLYLGVKARSLAFISAVNRFGGKEDFIGEDKHGILAEISPEYLPVNLLFEAHQDFDLVRKTLIDNHLKYPVIAKPNAGERGFGVVKIADEAALKTYFEQSNFEVIVQEFVHFEIELGVFFIRKPNEANGKVTSVTLKEFLNVVGDGKSTVRELLAKSDRARFQLIRLQNEKPDLLAMIPESGVKVTVETIGNHCKGTKFLNANHLINNELNTVFNKIASPIKGFHYGRFDLRVYSIADLFEGKNVKILELNGGLSEVTHIYDPAENLFNAYRAVAWHWNQGAEIAILNREKGILPVSFSEVVSRIRQHQKEQAQ